MIKTTEYRMGKPKTMRDKPLRATRINEALELSMKLSKANSTEERRVLVAEVMGELFYAWGNERKAWKDYLTYEENMNQPNGERA